MLIYFQIHYDYQMNNLLKKKACELQAFFISKIMMPLQSKCIISDHTILIYTLYVNSTFE